MPDPPSVAVQWIVTSPACHSPSEVPHVTSGALRSIWLGPTGPAWVVFPATSKKSWVPEKASAVSSPLLTVVDRVNVEGATTPEPPSVAVQSKS